MPAFGPTLRRSMPGVLGPGLPERHDCPGSALGDRDAHTGPSPSPARRADSRRAASQASRCAPTIIEETFRLSTASTASSVPPGRHRPNKPVAAPPPQPREVDGEAARGTGKLRVELGQHGRIHKGQHTGPGRRASGAKRSFHQCLQRADSSTTSLGPEIIPDSGNRDSLRKNLGITLGTWVSSSDLAPAVGADCGPRLKGSDQDEAAAAVDLRRLEVLLVRRR